MAATLDCARAGVTTGEWAGVLREVFGEYRAPTGVAAASGGGEADETLTDVRERVRATGEELGGRLRFLVGKPGLDGHSNGAEQIAVRARDAGFEVDLPGHPADAGADRVRGGRGGRARRRPVGAVGLAPAGRARRSCEGLREAGLDDVPVVVGGIIPDSDAPAAARAGRGPRLHAEGLRPDRDHGPDRRRRSARPTACDEKVPGRAWSCSVAHDGRRTAGRAGRRRRPHHDDAGRPSATRCPAST